MRGRLVWVRGGRGRLLAPSFPPPSPFPSLHPHVPPPSPFDASTTIFPCTPFYLPPAQNHQRFAKHKQPLPPKKSGYKGSPVLRPPQKKSGFRGVPVLCPLKTWSLWGSPMLCPPNPISPSGLGRIGQSHPGAPPGPQAAPSHSKQPLCALSPPRCSSSVFGAPRPPRSSVVLCCSFRCL